MTDPRPTLLPEALRPAPGGTVDLRRVAAALAQLDSLHFLPDQQSLLEELMRSGPRSPDEVTGATTWPKSHRLVGQKGPDGSFVPYVFSEPRLAVSFAVSRGLVEEGAAAMTEASSPARRIQDCVSNDFGGLWLDPGAEHGIFLDRAALTTLLELMAGGSEEASAPAPRPPGTGRPAGSVIARQAPRPPADGIPPAVHRLGKRPLPPAVPPPERPAAESLELLRELAAGWGEGRIQPWELLRAVAFQLDVYVPVDPQPAFGLRWPMVGKHPEDPERRAVHAFASEEAARALMESSGRTPDVRHLSGIEALRWMWALPGRVSAFLIHYEPAVGWLTLEPRWALSAIHPHFLHIPDLAQVKRVAPARLGELPGTQATGAESVRALVEGWRDLVGLADRDGAGPPPFEHEGGRYLPIFSGPEKYFDFDTAHPDASGAPAPVGQDEPFGGWVRASAGCDGAILDPGSRHPLVLDHTALLYLSGWARTGRRPDLLVELSRAAADLGPQRTGRVLADWPQYFLLGRPGQGELPELLTLPDRDCCAGFSTDGKAGRFFEQYQHVEDGLGDGWQTLEHVSGWPMSFFQLLDGHFGDGSWINPRAIHFAERLGLTGPALEGMVDIMSRIDPDREDGDGLHVSPEMVAAALERLDQTLTPRIEGFSA